MKLHLIDRRSKENYSWTILKNTNNHFLKLWHHHPELELVLILKSSGVRFIGDSIEQFSKDDLILIGKSLPHMWMNDAEYFEEDSDLIAEAIAIHFKEDFLGNDFFSLPEMNHIATLIQKARKGIKFLNINKEILSDIEQLLHKKSFERTIGFIRVLDQLANHKQYKLLASDGYLNSLEHTENKYLDKIYQYIFNNFKNSIDLETAAQIVNMNPSAFSRSFKRIHGKTFTRYINEIRVGYACKLLMENKLNITAICYDSGFNNLSNFNRQFKSIMNMPPSEYLRFFKKE